MILKIILNILITIMSAIFKIIGTLSPSISFINYITPLLRLITETIQTSVNFIYFLIGDAMYAFVTFAIFMLSYKFLIFPAVVIIRRVFIKGGDT